MAPPTLDQYADRYPSIRLTRTDGILQMTLHTDGGPLLWGVEPHEELGYCFADVGADPENEIVILTGSGDDFIADMAPGNLGEVTPGGWDRILGDGRRLLMNLLEIPVPVIAAVNGPALIHNELAVLSDLVIAAEHATFQDLPHYQSGLVPGDGMQIVWQQLLGPNRARWFLLTGQTLSAQEALALGVVGQVLPRDELLPRAWELARDLKRRPVLTRRYSRHVLVQQYKRLMLDELGLGLALEGLAAVDFRPEDVG
jgi:enoyl-CoA hydratase/carnithine racemase